MSGAPSRDGTLTIGQVLSRLEPDFPGLSLSKLRYLEAQGMVSPQRRPSGYRRYSHADVERIRYVLRAQQEWFWPLRVIREALDAMDRGLEPPSPATDGARPVVPRAPEDPVVDADDLVRPRELRLTRRELVEAAQVDPETVSALETYGLLRADAEGLYSEADLAVARAAAALSVHGVEARHLRPFRMAADRELGLVEQMTSGHRTTRGDDASRERLERARAQIVAECIALHVALVRRGLQGQ